MAMILANSSKSPVQRLHHFVDNKQQIHSMKFSIFYLIFLLRIVLHTMKEEIESSGNEYRKVNMHYTKKRALYTREFFTKINFT